MSGWHTSRRRDTLPRDWATRRQRIKTRAGGICEWRDSKGKRCTTVGRDCHHTGAATDHRDEVLMWICVEHHKQETQRQARAAQHAKYTAARKRQPEPHPGIRTRTPTTTTSPPTTLGDPPFNHRNSRRA